MENLKFCEEGDSYGIKGRQLFVERKYGEASALLLISLNKYRHELATGKLSVLGKVIVVEKSDFYESILHECLRQLRIDCESTGVSHGEKCGSNSQPLKPEACAGNDSKRKKDELELRAALLSCIVTGKSESCYKLVGLEKPVCAIKEAAFYPYIFPQMIHRDFVWTGILLLGPMGTGKSFLIKSISDEFNSSTDLDSRVTVFQLSMDVLINKYVGETEKAIKLLFELAKEKAPSIICIDEVDTLCCKRSGDDGDFLRRMKNSFLQFMDGLKSSRGVCVVGTTNTPEVFDAAFLRRFQKRIYVGLPTKEDRLQLMSNFLSAFKVDTRSLDLDRFVCMTDGYSGSDLKSVCAQTAYDIFKKEYLNAEAFKLTSTGNILPCDKGEGTNMNLMDIKNRHLLQMRQMKTEDLMASLSSIKKTNDFVDVLKLENWARNYATDFDGCDGYGNAPEWPFETYKNEPVCCIPFLCICDFINA